MRQLREIGLNTMRRKERHGILLTWKRERRGDRRQEPAISDIELGPVPETL